MEKAEIIRRLEQIKDTEFYGFRQNLTNNLINELKNEEIEEEEEESDPFSDICGENW